MALNSGRVEGMTSTAAPHSSALAGCPLSTTGMVLCVAATFIGTTIGAGYASGQEILQYFVSFGVWGGIGALLIAGLLFFVLSATVLTLAHRLRTQDIHDLVNPTSSRWPTRFADLCITVSLLGTLVIMLAGAGAALTGPLGVPPLIGALIMAGVCVLSVLAGVTGLVRVQQAVVPVIIVVALGVAIWAILTPEAPTGQDATALVNSSPLINTWWMSGILYVAFNIQLAYAVLAPVGATAVCGRGLRRGALLGALALMAMAGAIMAALMVNASVVGQAELPMVDLAARIGPWASFLFLAVLLLAQFTTAVSCLFGSVQRLRRVHALRRLPVWTVAAGTALVTAVLSGVGFSQLVGIVYPLLGYAGIVIIVMLLVTAALHRRRRRASSTSAPEPTRAG